MEVLEKTRTSAHQLPVKPERLSCTLLNSSFVLPFEQHLFMPLHSGCMEAGEI